MKYATITRFLRNHSWHGSCKEGGGKYENIFFMWSGFPEILFLHLLISYSYIQ
jgi:hypothetical protein